MKTNQRSNLLCYIALHPRCSTLSLSCYGYNPLFLGGQFISTLLHLFFLLNCLLKQQFPSTSATIPAFAGQHVQNRGPGGRVAICTQFVWATPGHTRSQLQLSGVFALLSSPPSPVSMSPPSPGSGNSASWSPSPVSISGGSLSLCFLGLFGLLFPGGGVLPVLGPLLMTAIGRTRGAKATSRPVVEVAVTWFSNEMMRVRVMRRTVIVLKIEKSELDMIAKLTT